MFKRQSTLRSPQLAKKRKKQLWVKVPIYIFLFLALFSLPPLLSYLPWTSINNVVVDGNSVLSGNEISDYVEEKISGKYFKIFSKRNIFLYPKAGLERDLLENFSRLQVASVSFKNLNSIEVKVAEREPLAVWCFSECYFIDAQGVIFAPAPTFSGTVYIKYHASADTDAAIGAQVIGDALFVHLHNFIEKIVRMGFNVDEVAVENDGDVVLHTTQGGQIMLTTREDFETTLSYLESLMSDRATLQNLDAFMNSFSYIDLRFGKKIFIK